MIRDAVWERQDGESRLWFRRFEAWLEHPRRSMLDTYRQEREKGAAVGDFKATSVPKSWRDAYRRFEWEARAAAYDKHLAQVSASAVERAICILRNAAPAAALALVAAADEGRVLSTEERLALTAILDRALPTTVELDLGTGGKRVPIREIVVELTAGADDGAMDG